MNIKKEATTFIYGNQNLDEILDYIEEEICLSHNGKLSEAQREKAKAKLQALFASIEKSPADDD